MKLRILFLSIFLTFTNFAFAQVQFEAKASKNKLGINERLRVDFEMNEDGDNFKPPSFENFTVVGGPNQAVSNSWINGKRTYSKTYSYFLAPKQRGTFTIGQAEIVIDDEVYKTLPIKVEVTEAVEQPTDGNNSEFIASENLHLVAEISKASPYINEAITVVYKLYVSPQISVSNWREIDNPTFRDFWSQNIDIGQLQVEEGEYQGEPYRYVVLRKTVLYPQKTGELQIEPLTLNVSVDVPTEQKSFFGGRVYTSVEQIVAAGKRTINVKPLPEDEKPADFTGAVGRNLKLSVTTNKTSLDATESLQAKVEVSGSGNLKLFDLPSLSVPSSLEMYEPEYSERVQTTLSGMRGSKSNTYTLVARQKGEVPLPALSFSYFDLDSRSYKTLTSEEILIDVKTGPLNIPAAGVLASEGDKQRIKPISDQFKYIKLNTNIRSASQSQFLGTPLFWSLFLAPALCIPLLILFGKKRIAQANDIKGNRIRRANKLARKYLSEAKKNLGNQTEFYVHLERALHNYLKAKLHIPTSEMSKERIKELLQSKGVREELALEFNALLSSCEFARYTPTTEVGMNQDYEKAVRVISEIDKQV